MTRVASPRETINGMQKVEREIIDRVGARQVAISAANFVWNHGRGTTAELPDPVHMEVRVGSRATSTDWLQISLQDSWDRIDRPDAHQEIERIVDILAPQDT